MQNYSDNRPACDNLTRNIDFSREVSSQPRQGKKPTGRPRKANEAMMRVTDQLQANPSLQTILRQV